MATLTSSTTFPSYSHSETFLLPSSRGRVWSYRLPSPSLQQQAMMCCHHNNTRPSTCTWSWWGRGWRAGRAGRCRPGATSCSTAHPGRQSGVRLQKINWCYISPPKIIADNNDLNLKRMSQYLLHVYKNKCDTILMTWNFRKGSLCPHKWPLCRYYVPCFIDSSLVGSNTSQPRTHPDWTLFSILCIVNCLVLMHYDTLFALKRPKHWNFYRFRMSY